VFLAILFLLVFGDLKRKAFTFFTNLCRCVLIAYMHQKCIFSNNFEYLNLLY
jgi:hypothetical protein